MSKNLKWWWQRVIWKLIVFGIFALSVWQHDYFWSGAWGALVLLEIFDPTKYSLVTNITKNYSVAPTPPADTEVE